MSIFYASFYVARKVTKSLHFINMLNFKSSIKSVFYCKGPLDSNGNLFGAVFVAGYNPFGIFIAMPFHAYKRPAAGGGGDRDRSNG